MKRLISRVFTTLLVVMTCFAIPGPLSWAQTNNASTNCAIAANPDECMREQTLGKWTSTDPLSYLGNRDLIKSGPFSASVKYDDQLSWILGLGYVRMLGEAAGVAMKVGLGVNELRGNLTAGYAITDKQQIKLTYEYLAQNLPFDFATGTVNEWASQNALGGAYQYLIRKGIVHSLELSGSYISAGSQDLPEIMFYQDEDTEAVNLRRIAGGKEATALASVNLRPHPNTSVILGAGYSGVNYDTMYNNDQNARAIAFKAEVAHVINPKLKLETGVNNTAASMDSKVTLSKILPKNFEMALTGQYSQGRGNVQDSKIVMVGLNYPAPKNYTVNSLDKLTELKNWIEKPIVYAARVLAVKDEAIRTYVITSSQDLPDQVVPEGNPIASINTVDYFQFDPTIYDQVTYTYTVAPMPNTPSVDGNALNLELIQDSPYQATLQSAAPLPYGTSGQYSITITATGEKISLKDPVVKSDTFILTVQAIGPGWTDKTLPTAPMGSAYPTVELNEGYVISNIPNDTFTFNLINGPSWLQVKDGHLLTAVDGAIVPQNTTSVPITLKVLNSDNQPSQKDFNIAIDQQLPIWNQSADYKNWSIAYDDTTAGIPLQGYITAGNSNLTFSFANNQMTSGNWMIVNDNGNSYLRRTTPSTPLPSDIGTTANLTIVAHNTTSTTESQESNAVQKVAIIVLQDQNLPAPGWSNTQLTANAGDANYKVDLMPLVNGSVTGDSYTFTLDNKGNTWLQLSADGQSLISNGSVQPIGTDATGNVTISLKAVSHASNKDTGDIDFTLTVTNFAPIWLDPPPADKVKISYDSTPGNASVSGVELNTLIGQNNSNLNFAFSSDGQMKTSGDGKWAIESEGSGYVLRLSQVDTSLIGATILVKVFALNSTSNGAVPYELPITVTGDTTQPGANWNNNALNGTTAGTNNYNDAVKKLFDCPAGDTCTVKVDLQANSWLTATPSADNTDVALVSTTPVPAAASDTNGVSDPLQVSVTSRISGKVIQKTFTIPIENVLPEWIATPVGNQLFDGKSTASIYLSSAIDQNTSNGLTFIIDPNYADKGNWEIIQDNDGYFLHALNIAVDKIGTTVLVPLIAKNTTSQNGAAKNAEVTIIFDGNLTAPTWNNNQLTADAGDMAYKIDLPPLVNGSAAGDTYTFTLDNQGNTWLQLSADGQSLISNGVPPIGTGATGDVGVIITALSKASNKTTQTKNNFTITVTNFAPEWADAIPEQDIEYSAIPTSSVAGIGLNNLIKANNTNLIFSFSDTDKKQNTSSDGKWTIVADGNGYSLKLAKEDANYIGQPADKVTVYAFNSTSNGSKEQQLSIVVIGDASQPGATWNNSGLAGTTAGINNYSDAVKKLFDCPSDDICTVTVDLKNTASWLAKQANTDNTDVTLSSKDKTVVPAAASDDNGVSDPIEITVNSRISGKQIKKDFTIPIKNILPEWTGSPTGSLIFNGKSPDDTVHLNPQIKSGTNAGLSFIIDPSFANNWEIVNLNNSGEYYLQRTATSDANDINKSPVSVSIIAKNTTSQNGEAGTALITVTTDSTLNINWKAGAALNGATAGSAIGTYASNIDNSKNDGLFSCDASDICQISIDTSKISWLQSNISSDKKQASVTNNSLVTMAGNDPSSDTEPLSVTVTSLGSGKTETQSFKIRVTNVLPEWISANPTTIGLIYDGSSPSTAIKLNDFVKPSAAGITTNLSFKAGAGFDTNKWKIEPVVNADITEYYLVKIGGDTSEVNTTAKVTVDATNSTSTTPIPNELQIPILPDTGLVLEQKGGLVTTARMGYDYATANVKLSDYVTTKDGSGNAVADNYKFTGKTNVPTWLNIDSATGLLTSTNTDPNNTDPNIVPRSAAAADFDVDVTSKASGVTTTFTFHVDVNTVPPIWGQIQPIDVKFTDQTQLPTNQTFADFLSQGADYSSFRIDTSNPEKCANYILNNWQPFSVNDAKHINRTAAGAIDPSDIANGSAYAFVPLVASNTTSPASADASICVPINVTADSNLIISGTLTTANMGSSDYSDDLNEVVTTKNGQSLVSDSYKFTVDSKNPLPTWLSLDASTGILSANTTIPTTADLPTQVTVNVNSKATGETKPITLTLNINTEDPVWNTIPQSAVVFTQKTTFPANGLTNYVKPSTLPNNINSFSVDGTVTCPISNYIAKNWDLSNSSLVRSDTGTQNYSDVNEDENNPATIYIPVRLANTTSLKTAPTCVPVTVNPDHNLAGPTISGQPIAATAGDVSYTYSFAGNADPKNNLVTCPSGDSCKIKTVDLSGLNWLQQTITPDGQNATLTLSPSSSVPAAQDSNTVGHSSPFSVKVYSIASGNSVTQDVTIPITNVMPQWDADKLPTDKNPAPIMFDAKDTAAGINLNQFIKAGTIGLTIVKAQGFDSTKWNIVQEGNNFTLVRVTTDTSDITTMDEIPLVAANTTSFGTVPAKITVIVTPDTSLPGPTINSTLGGTQAGNTANSYSYNLQNLFNCYHDDDNGIQDVCTITEVNLNPGSDSSNKNSTFLQADAAQGTLINNTQVPAGPSDAAPAGWPISVTVTSKASGKTAIFTKGTDNQNLQVLITNTQPQWTTNFPSLSIDDADTTTALPSTGLSSLLADGTKVGLTFSQGSNADAAQCPSENYNANNWKLTNTEATASLLRAQSDINDQFKTIFVPIKAYNTTSVSGANGVIGCVPVSVVSKLTFITTSGNIKFDALGEDKAVGSDLAAQGGFDITAAVSNADKYSNLRFDWGNNVAAPDYWQIKQDPSNKHYYILRNKKDNGTDINQVSAEGIGSAAKALNIQACYGDTSSATCVSQPINMTLQGDPNLVYSASALPSSLSTKSYEPFTANTESSNVDLIPGKNVMGYMPATAGGYQVIGDEATYTYSLVKGTPTFVGVNSQKLVVYQGSFDDFNNNTVVNGDYLQVSTAANNNTQVKVTGMPPVAINELYITPPSSSSNMNDYKVSGIILGNNRTGGQTPSTQQSYVYLNIKNLKDGQYYLSQIKANFPSSGSGTNTRQQVCPGLRTSTSNETTCTSGTPSVNFSDVSLANQKVITGASNSGLTFLASRNDYSGSTYPTFDVATSIIMSHQPISK